MVGFETADDAAVYRLDRDTALVQTVDVITPVLDDPFTFGQVAAANALSDVYAMGGTPLTAMNIIGFPMGKLDRAVMRVIIRGGLEKVREAGAVLCGGHSIKDAEIKYGLAVTGKVHPKRVMTHAGARPGDAVILTKRIGTGIISTALMRGLSLPKDEKAIAVSMRALNRAAMETALKTGGVHALTDVTGFGLIGHALGAAVASRVSIELDTRAVPLFNRVREYREKGAYPGGGNANREYCQCRMIAGRPVDKTTLDIMLDPQTSGGLLIFVDRKKAARLLDRLHGKGVSAAAIIGEVSGKHPGKLVYF